jgi:DNA repair protein RecN (Recombination protein N)
MLRYLKISNMAIIDKVEVEFHDGFNALTGETGAGKSILIGALNLLLGARVSPDMLRTGEEEAAVEGLFELPHDVPLPIDLPEVPAKTDEVILARRVYASGRSRCFVNGTLVTQQTLQTLGKSLVSIFGQNEQQVLLNPDEHIEVLDRFGGLEELTRQTSAAYHDWTQSVRALEKARTRLEEVERQGRENNAAVEELAAANLKEGEEEELVQDREILKKAGQIREKAFEAYHGLYGKSGSIMERFSEVRKAVEYLASANPKLARIKDDLEDVLYRIEDLVREIRGVSDSAHSDPVRMEQIDERLALIRRLKRKYGLEVKGLIAQLEELGKEADEVFEIRAELRRLETAAAEWREAYLGRARNLSGERRKAAATLEAAMKKELAELAMPEASFIAVWEELGEENGTPVGLEKVEFFLGANPGESPRPLARVASGGELSRIMLALKALQADQRGLSTVIFDEVDAGIGGHTAVAVGERLARVSRRQQVLCVTHLHQIAALADHHLSVRKSVGRGRTRIEVTPLNREMRVEELTRMLGAAPGSESAREHVRRLMDLPGVEVPP